MDKEKNELINLIKSNPKYISCISQYKDAIREVEISLQIDFGVNWRRSLKKKVMK